MTKQKQLKKVKCSYPNCYERRIHFQKPFTNRPHQTVDVPEDYEGNAYCSIECMMYHKVMLEKCGNSH